MAASEVGASENRAAACTRDARTDMGHKIGPSMPTARRDDVTDRSEQKRYPKRPVRCVIMCVNETKEEYVMHI